MTQLKPPTTWITEPSVVPERTPGYSPAQQNPAMQSSPAQSRNSTQASAVQSKQPPINTANHAQNVPPQKVAPHPAQRQQEQPRQNAPQEQSRQGNQQGNRVAVYVHRKIWTVHSSNKVIDFTDKLTRAKVEDYANIHGIGGNGHNSNSVIGITLCDHTKGSGNSTTLRCCLDVEDVDQLYEAAKMARLGKLKPDSSVEIKWMDIALSMLNDWKRYPVLQDGSRAIPSGALNAMFSTVSNAKASLMPLLTAPHYSYSVEKNNSYSKQYKETGLAPCYRLTINYSPFRKDGSPSSYPWYIGIETFDAPLITQKNGATNHNAKEAVNKKAVFINLSCDDFWRAMVAVQRYVRNWEYHLTGPLFREAFQRLAAQQEARNNT